MRLILTPTLKRYLLPALAFTHDVLMAGIAFVLSMYLRLQGEFQGEYLQITLKALPLFMIVAAASYKLFRLYRGLWRFASLRDLLLLTQAVTCAVLLFLPVLFLFHQLESLPRSVPFILWFVLLCLLGGPRFVYRSWKDRRLSFSRERRARGRIPVILLGAGHGAEQFIRAMSGSAAPYWVVGMLDDENQLVGRKMHNISILGGIGDLRAAVATLTAKKRQPQRVVITKPAGEITGDPLARLIDEADALGLSVGLMPSLTEFRSVEEVETPALNPVAIEDLLGRPQTILDRGAVERLVAGRRVLITGAGGTIGGELSRQVAGLKPARLVVLDQGEFNLYTIEMELQESFPGLNLGAYIADVREAHRIGDIFGLEKPEVVFHAAALKHVPLVEKNPAEGILTNTIGTRIVAEAARSAGAAAMVQISTDKAVKPANVMGAAKRLAEAYTQALDLDGAGRGQTRFITVRFGNVLGSTGSVVPLFRRQIAAGGPITVTHPDVERYFMTCREAVQLVLQASAYGLQGTGNAGRIFVLDMGKPVKIVDLARRMIVLSGLRPDLDIKIAFTGLRPGEKLTEELFEANEAIATDLAGVFSAAPMPVTLASLQKQLGELETLALRGDVPNLLAKIAEILPEYRQAI